MTDLLPEEAAIRHAVATGAYAEAMRLLPLYCQQLKTADEALHAKSLLDWIFRMTSAARAHKLSNLKSLAAVSQYLRSTSGRRRTLRLDG
jgi:hypothetical protein